MSSGYVSVVNSRKPDVVRPKGAPVAVNLSDFGYRFSVNDFRFANPITSYRSGPSFEREVRKPGAVFSERNLNEFLAAESGDLGHEFSMKKTTEFYGRTFSRRPDITCSPRWGLVTNPVPAGIVFSSGNYPLTADWLMGRPATPYGADPSYGFAKTNSELITLGTSFIKSTNPIQSQVNLLSSIAEFVLDGLPSLLGKQIVGSVVDPRKRRELIRSTGGEYLNYIFGYKPLADDIAKVAVLIDKVNSIVDQWIKDSGTIVRRRRKIPGKWTVAEERIIPSDASVVNSVVNFPVPGSFAGVKSPVSVSAIADASSAQANMAVQGFGVKRVSSELTFSAGFEYHVEKMIVPVEGESAEDVMRSAVVRDQLTAIAFGLDPGSIATAIYDATPFSWLLDWFANIGDVIDNFRGLNTRGVQMLWGYMAETVTQDSYYEWNLTWKPSGQVFFRTNGLCTQKVINRVRATPFGFGTSFGSLTGSQSATLAALGAAKSPPIGRR